MTTRSSSPSTSSSVSSDSEDVSARQRNFSETSQELAQITANARPSSVTNTIDATSVHETATQRTISPATSQISTSVTGTGYDAVSLTASTHTGTTNTAQVTGNIPIIRPPILSQQQSTNGSGIVGPQKPNSYQPMAPTNGYQQQPIKIDVAAAQQQYQQNGGKPDISPSSESTGSSVGESMSSPSSASIQEQRYAPDAKATTVNQANTKPQSSYNQANAQYQQQQQALLANQIPAQQVYNELLGPDAFKDVILDIDYGALGGFNAVFQSGADFSGEQLPPGISIRPAYTTVDSLHYQQHMFNTARTINAGGENNAYDYNSINSNYTMDETSNAYGVGGGQHFDITKAIFNQVDANRDGSISREEFQQWAQAGTQNYGGQTYSNQGNYQTTGSNYTNVNSSIYQASLFDGANTDVAKILQQSGLGQIVPN